MDVRSLPQDQSYILPESLLNQASYMAYRAIEQDNIKSGVVLSDVVQPRRITGRYQLYPTAESFKYPTSQYTPVIDVPMQFELGLTSSNRPPVASVLSQYTRKFAASSQS